MEGRWSTRETADPHAKQTIGIGREVDWGETSDDDINTSQEEVNVEVVSNHNSKTDTKIDRSPSVCGRPAKSQAGSSNDPARQSKPVRLYAKTIRSSSSYQARNPSQRVEKPGRLDQMLVDRTSAIRTVNVFRKEGKARPSHHGQ